MSITTEHLEKFVVDCQPKLDAIRTSLGAFNIFNVLGVQYREIRHSNFLGWMFDPYETHKLGAIFLKDLLKLLHTRKVLSLEHYNELLQQDLGKTQVYRESVHNIDILIVNQDLDFVICIENKIHADYAEHQLAKYHSYIERNYVEFNKRIYLTLTPSQSERHLIFEDGENYTNITYQDIIILLESNNEHIVKALPTVKESINQYMAMVQKDITHTSKEAILAKEIYKKYKKEIDFIISNQDDFSFYKNEK